MKQLKIAALVAALSSSLTTVPAVALPTLQLGILGASYDVGTETSVAGGNTFKLYAFLNPGDPSALLAGDYYISAALAPKTSAPASLGSFGFGATTVNATTDMTYGSPPLGAVPGAGGNLQDHGIFDTYFSEFKFNFSSMNKASSVDVQNNASLAGVVFSGLGVGDLYWAEFDIDVTGLASSTALHFDLYNSTVQKCKGSADCLSTIGTDDFAPFSHDAQSGLGGGGSSGGTTGSGGGTPGSGGGTPGSGGQVPEPDSGSLVVLAMGLLGASFWARRRAAAARL